jgi:DNA-binding MarR family transcriptional regulator
MYELTEKETKVLMVWAIDAHENCGCWGRELLEDNYSWMEPKHLIKLTGMHASSVGGILSSLEKKGIAWKDEHDEGYVMWALESNAIENGVLDFLGTKEN